MNKWNIKVAKKPKEIIDNLKASFGSGNSFVFNFDEIKNNSIKFDIRKRAHHMFQISDGNIISANGLILKEDSSNETNIEVSFAQHFFTKLWIAIYIPLCIGWIIFLQKMTNNTYLLIVGYLLFLIVGILYWLETKKKFKQNIKKYKTLLSEVFEK